jgi:CO/xanthine dehydrogenase Mo-binding subunit
LKDLLRRLPDPSIESTATIVPGSKDYIINSFAAHFCQVEVDETTGHVKVVRYVAAHDSGRIINRNTALNQVEGGVSQMLGLALLEEMVTDEASGVTLNGSFLEHKCPTISEYPGSMEVIFVEADDPLAPFGAKALGEPPSVPVAAAVANALHDATGIRFHEVPITPDRVLSALTKIPKTQ